MPDIFSYLDYRLFLKDAFEERKRANPHFSLRYISKKTGIKSTGFLSMVLNGKRNLSESLILELAYLFKLNKKERDYFRHLVSFNQARSHREKTHFYQEILTLQRKPVRTVTEDQYEFYTKWYYPAIRELVAVYDVTDETIPLLARTLRPPVKPEEVRSALTVLARLGLIIKTGTGTYKRTDAVISSGVLSAKPLAIQNFQLAAIDLAKSAIDRFTDKERELSTLTMSIDPDTAALIRRKIAALRSEIMEHARAVANPTQVFQLNMQLFPLSRNKEEPDA
jgi:uncharacterized protein (TIGR02147 family)